MIVCTRCSKENQDHYKFCLGCGSELPREQAGKPSGAPVAGAGASMANAPSVTDHPGRDFGRQEVAAADKSLEFAQTHQTELSEPSAPAIAGAAVAGQVQVGAGNAGAAVVSNAASVHAPVSSPSSASAPNSCPACGNPVPVDFKFCGTCGHRMPAAGQPAPPTSPSPRPAPSVGRPGRGSLVVINPDGTEGGTFALNDGTTTVGRSHGVPFSADAYLSPTHATFAIQGASCSVTDENSLNGVYVKLKRDVPARLTDGDVFRIGQELIRFDVLVPPQLVNGVEPMGSPNPGYVGRIMLVIGRESFGNGYPIPPDGIHLGRERGDVIFPEDGYVSGLHCRIHYNGSSCVLTDVGSSNGTFMRVRGSRNVVSGDLLLMGQQLFRLQF